MRFSTSLPKLNRGFQASFKQYVMSHEYVVDLPLGRLAETNNSEGLAVFFCAGSNEEDYFVQK